MSSIYSVRKGVFETNSSSSHSLFIPAKNSKLNQEQGFLDGEEITISDSGNYGWEQFKLKDWRSKARYLFAQKQTQKSECEKIKNVIKSFSGAASVEVNVTATVDHQSNHIIPNDLSKEEIKQLLFGKGVIYGGSDQDTKPPEYYSEAKKRVAGADYPMTAILDEDDDIIDILKLPTDTTRSDRSTPYYTGASSTVGADIKDEIKALLKDRENIEIEDDEEVDYYGWSFKGNGDEIRKNERGGEPRISIAYSADGGYDRVEFPVRFIDKETVERE